MDADSKSCVAHLDNAVLATKHDDADIVEEAWWQRRTIVTGNRRHFVTQMRRFQSRENQKECRDLWGLIVVNNLRFLREEGIPLIRTGLQVLPKKELLRWPGAAFLNLYVRLTASNRVEIRRFEKRCSCCERDLPPREPWNSWYRSLPLLGTNVEDAA